MHENIRRVWIWKTLPPYPRHPVDIPTFVCATLTISLVHTSLFQTISTRSPLSGSSFSSRHQATTRRHIQSPHTLFCPWDFSRTAKGLHLHHAIKPCGREHMSALRTRVRASTYPSMESIASCLCPTKPSTLIPRRNKEEAQSHQ